MHHLSTGDAHYARSAFHQEIDARRSHGTNNPAFSRSYNIGKGVALCPNPQKHRHRQLLRLQIQDSLAQRSLPEESAPVMCYWYMFMMGLRDMFGVPTMKSGRQRSDLGACLMSMAMPVLEKSTAVEAISASFMHSGSSVPAGLWSARCMCMVHSIPSWSDSMNVTKKSLMSLRLTMRSNCIGGTRGYSAGRWVNFGNK